MLAGLATGLGMLAARSIIQRELGSVEQGYFQAAWTISMTYLGFVLGAMGTDYYPRLTSAIHDHEQVNRLVNEQIEVVLLLAGPVIVGLLGLAPWAIALLYSSEFVPATDILRWQLLGDVLKITAWPLGFVILSAGAGKTFMLTESIAMSVFVLCIWLLIPELGVISTGISFLTMYCVYLPLVYVLARWRTGLLINAEVKVVFASLLAAAVAVLISGLWNDLAGAVLGVAFGILLGCVNLLKLIKS
ncbi:oligosaccharide flippase family protein [Alcanivorax sp. IO_7]|nr:oligosaccharide flippase family protein [Alcanivorax sp. IO_7]